MNVLKIGIRSIGRNKKRTVVTTLATGFAGFIMIFYASLMEGLMGTLERNALAMELGEMQIHAEGYRRDPDLYTRIESPDAVIEKITAGGFNAAPRLYGFGLAAAGVSSAGVEIRGLDIAREKTITTIHQHVGQGRWIDSADPKGVVIGKKLAKTLRVGLDDELVLLSQAADGTMANDLYRVRGILKTIGDLTDRGAVIMPAAAFRTLMAVEEGAHAIVVTRPNRSTEIAVATAEVASMAPGLDTKSWRELQPTLARLLDSSLASSMFMLIITYAAIAMVVLNATLMSVFERIREFGVMKALGVGPLMVSGVVLVEVLTQALLAVGIALLFGVPLSLYFERNGIDLRALGGTDMSFGGVALEPIWYCDVNTTAIVMPVAALFIMVGAAAIYPGIKAAVIRPLDAIRHR